ncbi:MAG: dihydropteroate synthase [Planctomycetes bacterium]|nr:dihydropteroate synthase [Planctomycetota bacterium]
MDVAAALSADARRLEPRLAHLTESRAGGFAYATIALRGERLTDDERAWIRAAEARHDGLSSWQLPLGELGLSLHTRVASLGDEHPLARLLRALAEVAAKPRERTLVMGIVNVTPDSFSDGGLHLAPERAVARGLELVAEGADLLDVGGESTRPNSEPVAEADELARVVPVIRALRAQCTVPISVDTQKAAVASAALDAGAAIVNDVSAGRTDPELLPLVARRGAICVLMHMLGTPRDMQTAPRYERDVVCEVLAFLRERAAVALEAGIAPERLIVDPGIGFGKRLEHNLALLRRTHELRSLGLPVLVGPSRKSFIADLERRMGGETSSDARPDTRVGGTAAAVALAVRGGAAIVRVHDARAMAEAARVAFACASNELDFPLA